MRIQRTLHLLITLIALLIALVLLREEVEGGGILHASPPFFIILATLLVILVTEWRSVRALRHIDNQPIDRIEYEHPFLPGTIQIIFVVLLTAVCTVYLLSLASKLLREPLPPPVLSTEESSASAESL